MQLDAVTLAGISEFLEHVTLERRGINDIVVTGSTLEHRETVMVSRRYGDVAGAGILDGANPLVGVEARGIKASWQLGILVTVNFLVEHHPLAVGKHRIDAPMDENAEFVVLELLAGFEVLLTGHIACLLGSGEKPCETQQERNNGLDGHDGIWI